MELAIVAGEENSSGVARSLRLLQGAGAGSNCAAEGLTCIVMRSVS